MSSYRHPVVPIRVLFLAALFSALSATAAGQLVDNAPGSALEHVESYQSLARGVRAQEAGQHGLAYDHFKAAARDANKTAQFMLGLMYLDGTYREIDPLRAWAWMALASERGYPQYTEVADQLWQDLGETFQPAARAILEEELEPVYGDAVAVPKVARQMRRERNRSTGSRVGSVGFLKVLDVSSAQPGSFAGALQQASRRDGSDYYARHKWDFEQLVELETRYFLGMGRVTITDIETSED